MSAVRRKTTTIGRAKKNTGPGKPRTRQRSALPQEEIAVRAYYIWESRGRPWGQSLEHWLEAERQLKL
jgi:hypothetical protein